MNENIKASVIKSAPLRTKVPPGLYHIVVEITDNGENVYLLLPMTNRVMPLNIVSENNRFATLEEVASAIAALHENTSVYAAEPHLFIPGDGKIRRLTNYEMEQLRRLLNDK